MRKERCRWALVNNGAAGIELVGPSAGTFGNASVGTVALARLAETVAIIAVATILSGLSIGGGGPAQQPLANNRTKQSTDAGAPKRLTSEQPETTRACRT
jgi:hypothetical protein